MLSGAEEVNKIRITQSLQKFPAFNYMTIPDVQVSKETVSVCRDSLEKHCDEDTVGKGETVCRTVYQTQCNTR